MRDYTDIVEKNKRRKEKDVGTTTSSSTMYDATPIVERMQLEQKINFDTLTTDFEKVNQNIHSTYNGWQPQDYMASTIDTVKEMRNRLAIARKYKSKYAQDWEFDVDGAIDHYEKAIEGWQGQSDLYKQFMDADSFSKAKKKAQFDYQFSKKDDKGNVVGGLTFDEVQEELKKYKVGSDEHNYLKEYALYTNLNDFDKAIAWEKGKYTNVKGEQANSEDRFKIYPTDADEIATKQLQGKKNPFDISDAFPMSPTGNIAIPDKVNPNGTKKDRDETASKFVANTEYLNALEREKNKRKLEHGANDYYAHYMEEEDFKELSQYTLSEVEGWWDKLTDGSYGLGYGDVTYEYINDVDGARSKIKDAKSKFGMDTKSQTTTQEKKGYDKLNPEEIQMYNYLYKKEGKESAQHYLDGMEVALSKRVYDEATQSWKDATGGILSDTAMSLLTFPMNLVGNVTGAVSSLKDAMQGKEYNPYGYYKNPSNFASDVRQYVGDDIANATEGMDVLGVNVPSFLYQTGMSIGDTVLGASTLGKGYTIVAGSGAFQQKAKELKEQGEDDSVVFAGALASGTAEIVFEYIGIDNLFKLKSADSIGMAIKNALKQAGVEGLEEVGTEITNILTDTIIRGNNSEIMQKYNDMLAHGYNDKEASVEIAKQIGSQVAQAGVGGFLSGTSLGGVSSYGNYSVNKSTGASIRENAQTEEMWDMSAMTPEESETYKLYTKYANKGINAGNIKDAKLGNLYNTAEAESYEALGSQKEVDRMNAVTTLDKLDKISKPNTDELRKKRVESLNKGEVTEVTATGNSTKIEGIKKVDGDLVVTTSEGEFKADEVTFSQNDAELLSYAENMSEDMANLFVSQYDGSASVDAYNDSFNLAVEYAKANVSHGTMLENRGVLTPDQVGTIYTSVVTNKTKAQSKTIAKLVEKHGKTMSYKGTINDSVIDYDSKTTDRSKVNWNSLTDSQRKGVTFLTGLAKATGLDAELVTDGLERGFNGAYMVENGKIVIDVYAGVNKLNMTEDSKDTIIPALSHEITHWSKAKSPEKYQSLSEDIFKVLTKGDKSEVQLINEEVVRLRSRGIDADVDYARDEIIARACEDMLKMSETGKEMFNGLSESDRKSLLDKVKDIVNDFVNWVNELLTHYESKSKEATYLRQYKEDLLEISKKWDEMFKESIEVNQAMKKEGITDTDIKQFIKDAIIQYSDKIDEIMDLDATVEQTEDLVAVHNLDETKLKKTFKLEGFPMPSIAITKVALGHSNFGSISFVFGKETINPSNRKNKVYGADAWTPTFPRTEYEADMKRIWEIRDELEPLIAKIPERMRHSAEAFASSLEFSLDSHGGYDGVVERALDDEAMKQTYLAITDGVVDDVVTETQTKMDEMDVEISKNIIESIGEEVVHSESRKSGKEILENYGDYIVDAMKKTYIHYGMTDVEAQNVIDNTTRFGIVNQLRQARNYLNNGGVEIKTNIDYIATREKIDSKINKAKYGEWIRNLFKGIVKNEGVYNGKDLFTPSGNRRSFAQTHMPVTADNIVKAMLSQNDDVRNVAGFNGIKSIRAVAVEEFKNIKSIREARSKLRNIDSIEYEEMQEKLNSRMYRVITEICEQNKKRSTGNQFLDMDRVGYIILDSCAEPTHSNIKKLCDSRGYICTDSQIKEIASIIDDVKNMPVNMFEAKPQRVVGFNEIQYAIVPDNISSESRKLIEEKGISIKEYEHGNEDSRMDVLNSLENVRFSDRDSDGMKLSKKQVEYFKDSKVRDEEGNLLVVYHGTRKADFTVFNRTHTYFTDSKDMADSYSPNREGYKGYLNITNPFVVDAMGEKWSKVPIDVKTKAFLQEHSAGVFKEKGKWRTTPADIVYAIEDAIEEGTADYDGVIIKNVDDTGSHGNKQGIVSNDYIAFNSNQFKNTDNLNPTKDRDIRYSDRDSDGNQLTKEQVEFFKESKARDEDGNLVVVHHGTVREFYTFDREYGNAEGNMGKGFYFTNSIEDVENNYANVDGADLTSKIEREADILEGYEEYENMSHEEIVETLREKYITSEEPITLDCYLDIKNPCYVGRYNGSEETYLFGDIESEYNMEDFEDEDDYYAEVDQLTESYVEDVISDIESKIELYDYDAMDKIRSILYESVSEGGVRVEDLRHSLGDLYLESEEGLATSEVLRIIIESLGYDGIIDSTVAMKFKGMGLSKDTVHYVVFNSNQAKLTTNTNPTENVDIRYSDRDLDIDAWLDDLSIDELMDFLKTYDPVDEVFSNKQESKAKKQRAKRRVDEVNKRLKEIGLLFNGTKTVAWTDERINTYLGGGYYGSSNPTYAQAYITYITPQQFLNLTMGGKTNTVDVIQNESESYGELDFEKLDNGVPLFLEIEEGKNGAKVVGHEGRHRMYLLGKAGFENVPILIFDYRTKYNKAFKESLKLTAQIYNDTDLISKARNTVVSDVIPFSQGNRDLIIEKFGSGNQVADIHFSDRINDSVYDVMGENESLKKLNKILTEDVQRLRERVRLEGAVTNGKVFDANQLHSVAVYLNKTVNSAYNSKQLAKDLERLYSYIAQSKDIDEQSLFAKCNEIARNILAEQRGEKVVDDYYKGILDDLRIRRISLSEDQIKEVQSQYGDRYRNAFMGKIMITKDGVSLDSVWQELSQMYPEVFDAETTEADQPLVLLEIYDSARESSVIYQKYMDAETTMGLATEIYNKYWTAPRVTTVADKYTAEIKKLNFEHRKAMGDLRADFNDRLQKQKTADAIHYGKIINKLRQREHSRVQEAREFGRRRVNEVRDRAERNAKIRSITDKALTLNKWLLKNSKDEHIAEPLKKPVAYLLDAINFSSKQLLGMRGDSNAYSPTQKDISLSQALEEVHEMARGIKTAQIGKDDISAIYGTFADFPVGFADDVSTLSKEVNHIMRTVGDNEFVLNQMSLDSLKELDKIVTTIKSTVTKMNKFLAVRHAQGVANLSQTDIQYLDSLGKGKVEGRLKKMLNWGNALPYYAFKRFGEGGQKVYEALMDGWDKFAFHTKQIIDYAESVYTADEIKKWESDIKTFDVLEPSNDADFDDPNYRPTYQKIQMTVPQIMSLYCLQKREQAKDHLKGGGIRIADIEVKQGAKKDVISQSEGVIFAESEIETIINSLTSRQREVADKLQEFMNTVCTDWGNEVSMLRFGYKAFGEENYFPIQSDENNLAVNDETENNNRLFRLLNMSFTKSTTKKANNRIVISNIFDVFAQHTSDMAKYNALALPVLDSFKWYNYKEKIKQGETQHKTKSLKQSLENAYGKNAQNYITTFLRDINGSDNSSRDTVGKHFFTNAKIASVGMNLRVALLQPTSYLRASAVIDTKYLIRAMGHKPKIARAEKYCGIAQWKALGFYDTNIQRGVTELIKHTETVKDKAVEVSLKGAEIGDKVTWGYLWNACELEIRETRKDLKVGSDEFYHAIGKRLSEVIYATQVVDSTMTRSEMMRSSDWRDKTLTAFASEPTLSYNMMQDAIFECKLAKRRGEGESEMRGHRRHFVRVAFAYTVTNMMCALVESGFDAFRDDEEEEMDLATFMKMYLKNFATDMSFIAKVPYLKDAISILQGYSSTRTDTQWMSSFYYAGTGLIKNFQGKGNAYTTFKNFMKGFSYVSGLSFYNAWRDSISLLNKTEILTVDELEDAFNEMFGIEK